MHLLCIQAWLQLTGTYVGCFSEIHVNMPTGRGSQLDFHLSCDGNSHVLDAFWFSICPSPAGLQCSKAVPASLGLRFASC